MSVYLFLSFDLSVIDENTRSKIYRCDSCLVSMVAMDSMDPTNPRDTKDPNDSTQMILMDLFNGLSN